MIDGLLIPQTNYSKIYYLLHNPLNVIYLVVNTLERNLNFYITTYVGSSLGKFNISQPTYISIIYYLISFLSLYVKKENQEFNKKEKRILIITWILNSMAIFGGLYLGWGEVRNIIVDGVQGRYFIPINIILFTCLYSKKSFIFIKNKHLVLSLMIFILNIISIYYVMNYFLA